jgi:hypothetical protein
MAEIQVNWVRDWPKKTFSSSQKKSAYKAKAIDNIDAQIASLNNNGAKISPVYSLRWIKERSTGKNFLRCYINPAAEFIRGEEDSEAGSGGSTVSPQRPPMP